MLDPNGTNPQVMIDIETLGKTPGSVILSIGAVVFTKGGDVYEPTLQHSFYRTIDLALSMEAGFTVDADTIRFWMKQDMSGKEDLFVGYSPFQALDNLKNFHANHNLAPVWSHGPSFDISILEAAFHKMYISVPWAYNSPRDTRTIYDLAGLDIKKETRRGIFHNALDDCIFQAAMVQKAWKKLMGSSQAILDDRHTSWGVPVVKPTEL